MNLVTLSLYIGYALYIVFPFTENILTMGGTPLMRTVLSLLVYAIAVAISFFVLRKVVGRSYGSSRFPQLAIQIVLAIAFVFALGYHGFAITRLYAFPQFFATAFEPNSFFFWWFIAPLVGLFFLA